jgi:hypothetical protein
LIWFDLVGIGLRPGDGRVRLEGCADFGGTEEFFCFVFGLRGGLLAPLKGREGAGERAEVLEFEEGGIVGLAVPLVQGDQEPGGKNPDRVAGRERSGIVETGCIVRRIAKGVDEFAAGLPFNKTALAPLGEILFGDGLTMELGMEDFIDFGQAVEPLGELRPREVALKAAVEFVANFAGKTGDFSGACHKGVMGCKNTRGDYGVGKSSVSVRERDGNDEARSQNPEGISNDEWVQAGAGAQ